MNYVKSKTRYHGISDYIPDEISSIAQSNINEILKLSECMPDIDEILKVSIDNEIINSKLVKTALGVSLEGQKLTGWKYISEGFFYVRVDYCSNSPENAVHTFKSSIPFNIALELSENTHYNSRIIDSIFIEDIYSQVLNKKEALINISFIFTAENC